MKPLYWTRIVVPVSVTINVVPEPISSTNGTPPPLWEQLEEAKIEDMDAFTSLFSRQVIERKPTKKKTEKPSKQQVSTIVLWTLHMTSFKVLSLYKFCFVC